MKIQKRKERSPWQKGVSSKIPRIEATGFGEFAEVLLSSGVPQKKGVGLSNLFQVSKGNKSVPEDRFHQTQLFTHKEQKVDETENGHCLPKDHRPVSDIGEYS